MAAPNVQLDVALTSSKTTPNTNQVQSTCHTLEVTAGAWISMKGRLSISVSRQLVAFSAGGAATSKLLEKGIPDKPLSGIFTISANTGLS